MILRKFASYLGLCFILVAPAQAQRDQFHGAVAFAAKISTLAAPGGPPFHLKLTAQDTVMKNPEYNAEIEIWWAAPDKWRRSVKSPAFTQIAVQNGARYYESNSSADYLPYWLDELIRGSIDPIPVDALADVTADTGRPDCGSWEIVHATGDERLSSHASMCFNPDGTAREIFAQPIALALAAYQQFGNKQIARQLQVWPGDRSQVTATVALLEPMENGEPSAPGTAISELFDAPEDTGLASRVRFVSVPETALAPADSPPRPPIDWPGSYTFPLDGVVAVTVQIDRAGNVREFPSAISRNQVINTVAVAQIKDWKFKPYLVGGSPVEVVTTLRVPFHLKYQPLGANGKEFPPISFEQHIKQYRELSDLRVQGSNPFQLDARFVINDQESGKYQETWQSADDWTRRVEIGNIVLQETRTNGSITTSFKGGTISKPKLQAVIEAIQDRLPDPATIQEADWGNSAVPESNVDPSHVGVSGEPVLIRAARGAVDANNHPISGQAYWFDSDGLLRANFASVATVVNSRFAPWGIKQVPRHIEVFVGMTQFMVIIVDSIKAP